MFLFELYIDGSSLIIGCFLGITRSPASGLIVILTQSYNEFLKPPNFLMYFLHKKVIFLIKRPQKPVNEHEKRYRKSTK